MGSNAGVDLLVKLIRHVESKQQGRREGRRGAHFSNDAIFIALSRAGYKPLQVLEEAKAGNYVEVANVRSGGIRVYLTGTKPGKRRMSTEEKSQRRADKLLSAIGVAAAEQGEESENDEGEDEDDEDEDIDDIDEDEENEDRLARVEGATRDQIQEEIATWTDVDLVQEARAVEEGGQNRSSVLKLYDRRAAELQALADSGGAVVG